MQRHLAAILAADVVGYAALMGRDEAGTFQRLKQGRQQLFEPEIARCHGRIFKLMGDGLLAEFGSVAEAVECAVALQRGLSEHNASLDEDERFMLRIGINLGEIIVDGEDRFGEGVNIAARLEQMAEPGSIFVSGKVSREVDKKLGFAFEPLGEHRLKNIAEPVAVYRVSTSQSFSAGKNPSGAAALPLPDKPSIAVLPFQNMTGDVEQEYFADGIVEEIITALSRLRWLFVIARNSSFTYKNRAVDVRQIGREQGVRYVLEGSVRKAGNRIRIAGQLIDASTGMQIWADRFDGEIEDIFDLQDQVTAKVVGAIAPRLEHAEIERVMRKPTANLDAYDHYLRGLAELHQRTREANEQGLSHFYRAIQLDPAFASAYAMAARCYPQRRSCGWTTDPVQEVAETTRLARRAAELGREDSDALSAAGFSLAYIAGEPEEGSVLVERALALNPNSASAWLFGGWIKLFLGDPEAAIAHTNRAMRLSPHDTDIFNMQAVVAYAHLFAGRFDEATIWAEMALRARSSLAAALRVFAAGSALKGLHGPARRAVDRLVEIDPALRISKLREYVPLRRQEDLDLLARGLRQAGLPE